MKKATRYVAAAILIFLFLTNVYRAATQSIAHDEAYTYQLYLATPSSFMFEYFNPNNHFFATLLMKISTSLFGASEFTMRLPTLAAGALYFFVVYKLCLMLFGEGLLFLVSVALLSTNPFVLDFHVAARGYGMGLSFLFTAIYCLLLYCFERRSDWKLLVLGATALSLAVASNPTFFFPSLTLAALFVLTLPPLATPQKKEKRRRQTEVVGFAGRIRELRPFIVTIAAFGLAYFLSSPANRARTRSFYRPVSTLSGSLESIVSVTVAHNPGLGGLNSVVVSTPGYVTFLALILFPAIVVGGLLAGWRLKLASVCITTMMWASGTVAGSILLHVIGKPLLRLPYPADRTGVYLPPLVMLTLVCLSEAVKRLPVPAPRASKPLLILAAWFAAQYAIQFNWERFQVWPYDADSKRIVERLGSLRGGRDRLSVGLSWQLEPSFNFYRETRKLSWLPRFDRSGLQGDYEYYVVIPQDRGIIKDRNLTEVFRGSASGTILATRQGGVEGQ